MTRSLHSILKALGRHRGALAGWFQQAGSAFAAMVCVPVIMRHMGAEKTGIWLAFQSLAATALLADFGTAYVTARQTAFSLSGAGGGKVAPDIDSTQVGWQGVVNTVVIARRLNLWSCAVGCLAIFGLAIWLTTKPQFQALSSAELVSTWLMLGAALIITMLSKPDTAILEGSGRFAESRCISATQIVTSGLGAAVLAYFGAGLPVMAAYVMLTAAAAAVYFRYRVTSMLRAKNCYKPQITSRDLSKFARVAFPIGIVNVGSYCFSAIQIPFIAVFLSPALVAPFYLAQRCGQFINTAVLQLLYPKLPEFSALLGANDLLAARRLMQRTLIRVSCLSLCAAIAFVIGVHVLCKPLMGTAPPSPLVLIAMAIDYLVLNCVVAWAHFVLSAGRNPFVISTVLTGAVNLCALYLLLPNLGLLGIPVATLLSGLVASYWYSLWKGYRMMKEISS